MSRLKFVEILETDDEESDGSTSISHADNGENDVDDSSEESSCSEDESNPTSNQVDHTAEPSDLQRPMKRPREQDNAETNSSQKTSKWLSNFLQSKRQQLIIPAPELELSNDVYIRGFHASLQSENGEVSGEPVSNESEEDDDVEFIMSTSKNDSLVEASDINEEEQDDLVHIRLYNLPYKISVEEIKEFAVKHKCEFKTVEIIIDKKSGLPSGSAIATGILPPGVDEVLYVETLQNEDCGGRPLRVQLSKTAGLTPRGGKDGGNSGSPRYFGGDAMSSKCSNCGKVGHRQHDCQEEVIPLPCHLCAGKDHEAVKCPNITCFRCGIFGHHSRDCRNARMSRPVICTECGGCNHETRACPGHSAGGSLQGQGPHRAGRESRRVGVWSSKFESSAVKCMNCNELGHDLCARLPDPSDGKFYCPNCGEEGHHVDYPPPGRPNPCRAPRFEAYSKFNSLFEKLADPLDGSSRGRNETDTYWGLVRSQSNYDQTLQLFPCLQAPSGADASRDFMGSAGGAAASAAGGGYVDALLQARSVSYAPSGVGPSGGGSFWSRNHQDRFQGGDRDVDAFGHQVGPSGAPSLSVPVFAGAAASGPELFVPFGSASGGGGGRGGGSNGDWRSSHASSDQVEYFSGVAHRLGSGGGGGSGVHGRYTSQGRDHGDYDRYRSEVDYRSFSSSSAGQSQSRTVVFSHSSDDKQQQQQGRQYDYSARGRSESSSGAGSGFAYRHDLQRRFEDDRTHGSSTRNEHQTIRFVGSGGGGGGGGSFVESRSYSHADNSRR